MRTFQIVLVALTLVGGPTVVWAQSPEKMESAPAVAVTQPKPSCPMMQQMGEMQKDMHDMMQLAPSGDLRTRMETMHEKMDAMMEQMSGSCHSDTKPSEVPAPADKQDHEEHHIPPQ